MVVTKTDSGIKVKQPSVRQLCRSHRLVKASLFGLIVVVMMLMAQMETAMAEQMSTRVVSAEILPKVQSGEVTLIDIRTPQEWAQTGVAELAQTNSMHEAGFLERLDAMIDGDKDKTIALICATGGRSSYLQSELTRRGYKSVIDVTDGMIGSGTGPGWLGNGFSTRKIE